jgi:thymidylate synthase (FAD)
MGDDAAIVQAARVSYGKDLRKEIEGSLGADLESAEMSASLMKSKKDERQLIRYLMRHRHTTPFEMAEVKLLVRVPMDCWRQWIRHRTANVNEYSTRYSEAIDSKQMTGVDEWRLQATDNKQGSSGYLKEWPEDSRFTFVDHGYPNVIFTPRVNGVSLPCLVLKNQEKPSPGEYLTALEADGHGQSAAAYGARLLLGVAREQARKDLPLSTYTEAYWKCDLHNILNFLRLRMDSHAQKEIREYATVIGEQIIYPLFPVVWEAFQDYQLNAMTLTALDIEVIQTWLQVKRDHGIRKEDFFKSGVNVWMPEDWQVLSCRERDECLAKLERLDLI